MKPNSKIKAGAAADSKQKVEDTSVRQHRSKPHVSRSLLNWMDKKLTQRFITKAGIKTQPEITHIKLTIWDFLAEFEQKLSKQ